MDARSEERFIGTVERLIDPMVVSNLLCFQSLKKLLPAFVLKGLLRRASRKTPHIGFVIEPYSLFLFFRLKDLERAARCCRIATSLRRPGCSPMTSRTTTWASGT